MCGTYCGVPMECAVEIYVSLGHGLLPALPLALLLVGLFFKLSFKFGNLPRQSLVARFVGSVLHP